MNILKEIAKYIVGGLFIFSGLIKVNDPVGTAIKMEEYFQVFAEDFGSFFAIFIPGALPISVFLVVLEVVIGIAILINYRPKITIWVLSILILFFTFLTFYSAYFNKVTDCGCFGDAIKLTPWESFIKDLILVAFIAILFIKRNAFQAIMSIKKSDIVVGISTILFLFISIQAIRHLPFVDFRTYKIGNNIKELMSPSEELRYIYVMEKDGEEVELDQYPTDPSYKFKEMILANPEAQPKIVDYSIENEEGDFTEESFTGTKLFVIIYNTSKASTSNISEIKELANSLQKYQIDIWGLTASSYTDFEAFRHENQLAIPFFLTDATVLKTMVRSNPGLVLVKNGTVLGKWHHNDVPDAQEVVQLL